MPGLDLTKNMVTLNVLKGPLALEYEFEMIDICRTLIDRCS